MEPTGNGISPQEAMQPIGSTQSLSNEDKTESPEHLTEDFRSVFEAYCRDMEDLLRSEALFNNDWIAVAKGAEDRKNRTINSRFELKKALTSAYNIIKAVIAQDKINEVYVSQMSSGRSEHLELLKNKALEFQAGWQTDCVSMIRQFETLESGEEFIESFWKYLTNFAERVYSLRGADERAGTNEARRLKSGIMGLRLAEDVLAQIVKGTEARIEESTPEEDVRGATDLKIFYHEVCLPVQVKTSKTGYVGTASCTILDHLQPTTGVDDTAREKIMRQNEALRHAMDERISDRIAWMEIAGTMDSRVNQTTGRATEDFLHEQAEGETGNLIRYALGIN